ncbi:unnamed protein product [Cladocopium goreaui]|uniref:Copia protein n=1 Tax=Cladocopium goreaui TaxID=2562237 RepID=A0A9P1GAF8_9DINO|nr:unnamed protein product [Cladocopium goreaui]
MVKSAAESCYGEWLRSGPLERLRLRPTLDANASLWPRTERRAVAMLLQAIPSAIRDDLVSSRRMTSEQIIFKLMVVYQPGGAGERTKLLQAITGGMFGETMTEVLEGIRHWRRNVNRASELGVTLPDALVLVGALQRASDLLSQKSPQVAYRLNMIRQQLNVDHQPTRDTVMSYSEHLQAEAEEMNVNSQGLGLGQPTSKSGGGKVNVKSLNGPSPGASANKAQHDGADQGDKAGKPAGGSGITAANAGSVASSMACKFWGTENGCRKADQCRYVHSVLNPKDNRCFKCSAVGHSKKDCPVGKKKIAKTKVEKDHASSSASAAKGGAETAVKAEPSRHTTYREEGTPTKPLEDKEGVDDMVQDCKSVLKVIVPVMKTICAKGALCKAASEMIETGLLDGGATNPLRKGSKEEIEAATLVDVELATGSVQLSQNMSTGVLLSPTEVEPIVPLRGVVALGYKIRWDSRGQSAREWQKGWPPGIEILTVDTADSDQQNLHRPEVWAFLAHVVRTHPIVAIIGGPPCRTVSRLQALQSGLRPLRDRCEHRFGLPGLSDQEQHKVDGDSALLLKQVGLHRLAEESKTDDNPRVGFFLESPEDPAVWANEANSPTFWVWPEVTQLLEQPDMRLISFDQGRYGHERVKPTSCLSNLPFLEDLDQARCERPHGKVLHPEIPERVKQTDDWSAWAPGLKHALRVSLNLLIHQCGLADHQPPLQEPPTEVVEAPDLGEGLEESEFPLEGEEESGSPELGDEVAKASHDPANAPGADPEIGGEASPEKSGDWVDEEISKCSRPLKLKHVTMVEPVQSRSTTVVLNALSQLVVRMKSYGINVNRLHSDRAKELIGRQTAVWCAKNGLRHTFGGGDDPANNGHVEAEINQLKRRTRLYLRNAGFTNDEWPTALRYSAEERMRVQLSALGVTMMPMLPYGASVVVKRKRWHSPGVLAPPYVNATLLTASPNMSQGWVVRSEAGQVLHVREAILPASLGEQVAMELREESAALPQLEERDDNGAVAEPSRRRLVGKQPPSNRSGIALPDREAYGPVQQFVVDSTVNRDDFEQTGEAPAQLGFLPAELPADAPYSPSLGPEDTADLELPEFASGGRVSALELPEVASGGESLSALNVPDLEKIIVRKIRKEQAEGVLLGSHNRLLMGLSEALRRVPTSEQEGLEYGKQLRYMLQDRLELEEMLQVLSKLQKADMIRLCRLRTEGIPKNGEGDQEEVLQSTTVALEEVRRDLAAWTPAMQGEYNSLVKETQAIEPVSVCDLDDEQVEYVPGKLVCVRKAGKNGGRKKCRAVICGNLLDSAWDPAPSGAYASGADGTMIRAVINHGVQRNWGASVTDIRTAFLLAPRPKPEGGREVIVVPPKVMIQAGVIPATERWRVHKALYGFTSSPAHWSAHRDRTMKTFQWLEGEWMFYLRPTEEANLWKIWKVKAAEEGREEVGQGILEYLAGTPDLGLMYEGRQGDRGPEGNLPIPRNTEVGDREPENQDFLPDVVAGAELEWRETETADELRVKAATVVSSLKKWVNVPIVGEVTEKVKAFVAVVFTLVVMSLVVRLKRLENPDWPGLNQQSLDDLSSILEALGTLDEMINEEKQARAIGRQDFQEGCPGSFRACALRLCDAMASTTGDGAGGDEPDEDRPDKSWVKGDYEPEPSKKKKKKKKKGKGHRHEGEGETAEDQLESFKRAKKEEPIPVAVPAETRSEPSADTEDDWGKWRGNRGDREPTEAPEAPEAAPGTPVVILGEAVPTTPPLYPLVDAARHGSFRPPEPKNPPRTSSTAGSTATAAGPTTDVGPTTDAGPTTDVGPTTDAGPTTDVGPTTDAGPTTDDGPSSSRSSMNLPGHLVSYSARGFGRRTVEWGYYTPEGEPMVIVPASPDRSEEHEEWKKKKEEEIERLPVIERGPRDPPPDPPAPALKLAALRMPCSTGRDEGHGRRQQGEEGQADEEEPWERAEFQQPPSGKKDGWTPQLRGWVVRKHGTMRERRFHPLHRGVPFDPNGLEALRVTVAFGQDGRRTVHRDRWSDGPRDLFPTKESWRGFTFFKLKSLEGNQDGIGQVPRYHAGEDGPLPYVPTQEPFGPTTTSSSTSNAAAEPSSSTAAAAASGAVLRWGYRRGGAAERGRVVVQAGSQTPRPPANAEETSGEWSVIEEV